jgi:hypothetical protein
MNKYTRYYNKHIDTFPPKKCWTGTPKEYVEALDNYKDYILKTVDEITTIRKATNIQIMAGQSGYSIVAMIDYAGEMTEEEKLQKDKEDRALQERIDNAEKDRLKELMKKYPETVKEVINE